jgi:hypothetical protein
MTASAHAIPPSSHGDSERVRRALAVAARCFAADDPGEALRFLRFAAREAADDEQLARAIELSKTASELAAALDAERATQRRSTVVPRAFAPFGGDVPPPAQFPWTDPSGGLDEEAPIPLARPLASATALQPVPATALGAPLATPAAACSGVGPLLGSPPAPLFEDDEPTVVRSLSSRPPDERSALALTASRVAVFLNRERGTLEVTPLASDQAPPPGAPVAMLVAASGYDAEGLAALLRQLA